MDDCAVRLREGQVASVDRKSEVRVQFSFVFWSLVLTRAIDQEVFPRWEGASGERPFTQSILIVGELPPSQFYRSCSGVVKFEPIRVFSVFVLTGGVPRLHL